MGNSSAYLLLKVGVFSCNKTGQIVESPLKSCRGQLFEFCTTSRMCVVVDFHFSQVQSMQGPNPKSLAFSFYSSADNIIVFQQHWERKLM